jgi:uncharacterized membrane protein
MKRFSLNILMTRVDNWNGLKAFLNLVLKLKMTIPMVSSLITIMHLIIMIKSTLIDISLHISGKAAQIIALCTPQLQTIEALALYN